MSLLLPIDTCSRCNISIRSGDILIVGDTNGKFEKSWWKLCPKCYEYMYKKHVIPGITLSKGQQRVLNRDSIDLKIALEKSARIWKQF